MKPKPGAYLTTPTQDPTNGASVPHRDNVGIIAEVLKFPKSGRLLPRLRDLPV
jgi:hypothetical protein